MSESGTLYLVPTPIGNEGDITQRAIEVLRHVDLVACEDTRSTGPMLGRLGLGKPTISYHDHNEQARAAQLIEKLRAGTNIALVSDAGTPLLADPGYRIVTDAAAAGIEIVALPGACAAVTALVASGLPTYRSCIVGFLPRKTGPREQALKELSEHRGALVVYEAPHRLLATLNSMESVLGNRAAVLGWNLTKSRERYLRGSLSELHAELSSWEFMHGECTLVVAGAAAPDVDQLWEKLRPAAELLLAAGVAPRLVRDALSALSDLPRRDLYKGILSIRTAKD